MTELNDAEKRFAHTLGQWGRAIVGLCEEMFIAAKNAPAAGRNRARPGPAKGTRQRQPQVEDRD